MDTQIILQALDRIERKVDAVTAANATLMERVEHYARAADEHDKECMTNHAEAEKRLTSIEHFRTRLYGIAAVVGLAFSVLGGLARDALAFVLAR